MKRDDSPRHQIQWDILGFIGLIVAALIAAGVAIWQAKQSRESDDSRPPAVVTVLVVVTATPSRPTEMPAPTQPAAGPFREYQTASIGSGPLMQVTFSDGLAPYTDEELATNYYHIQRIRLEENPDGCGISIYNTNKIWFGSAMLTTITVNDVPIADLYVLTGKHGYIFEWSLKVGDKICVTDFNPSGFHIIFGPDLYYHYDSYCYRGHCD